MLCRGPSTGDSGRSSCAETGSDTTDDVGTVCKLVRSGVDDTWRSAWGEDEWGEDEWGVRREEKAKSG